METIVIRITGMRCQACVQSVRAVLEALRGVEAVAVSLEPGQATVSYDPTLGNVAILREAVEQAGFDAS
ncbi:MAG TPA: heavy metal-associated domain-containing protein [Accumulibacter sp.]|nr:heavy metal-associated domain-containing protein [Accumulibacter sp.]